MRVFSLLGVGLLAACEAVEPSGALFDPVVEARPAPAPTPDAVPAAPGFDFDADAVVEDDGPAEVTPELVAAGLGLGSVALVATPAAEPVPTATEVAPAPSPTPGWTPQAPMSGSWGVRLVSTVHDAQPPRAILGMPDGTETVVTPGTLLPDARIVVLAVGRDAVQVAEIIPSGDHARVETRILEPLFRQGGAQ